MSNNFNILIIGVGGQGIGLLSEAVIRAAYYADLQAKGVDTHGLAQRGGTVTSQIRLGNAAFSPLIQLGKADIVIALERHEALRGMNSYLKNEGDLVFYDAVWQPLDVRMRQAQETSIEKVETECKRRNIKYHRVFKDDLTNSKMQNVVVLGYIAKHNLIPGITKENYLKAIKDLLKGDLLEENIKVFDQ